MRAALPDDLECDSVDGGQRGEAAKDPLAVVLAQELLRLAPSSFTSLFQNRTEIVTPHCGQLQPFQGASLPGGCSYTWWPLMHSTTCKVHCIAAYARPAARSTTQQLNNSTCPHNILSDQGWHVVAGTGG